MAAPNGFPSYAYNSAGQPSVIVLSLAAFNALPAPGTWSSSPFSSTSPGTTTPIDSLVAGTGSYTATDTRLQQLVVEARVQSAMMAQAFNITDDPQTVLRPDVLANDASLTS